MDKGSTLSSKSRLTELVRLFEEDRESLLSAVYGIFRKEYMVFSRKYSNNDEMCLDSFQEAVIALYENLSRSKINHDSALVKTYLFSIGKNKLLNAIAKQKNETSMPKQLKAQMEAVDVIDPELLEILATSFDRLGDRCKEVLMKFYYHRYSIEAIAHDMEYKNENTVKAHKSRCVSQLRNILRT